MWAVEVCYTLCHRLTSYCHVCSVLPLQVRPSRFSCRFLLLHHPTHNYTHTYLMALPPHVFPCVVETSASSHANFEQPVILQSRQGRSKERNVSSLNKSTKQFLAQLRLHCIVKKLFFCKYVCVSLVFLSSLFSNISFHQNLTVLDYTFSNLSHIFFVSAKRQVKKLLTRNNKNGVLIINGTIKNST